MIIQRSPVAGFGPLVTNGSRGVTVVIPAFNESENLGNIIDIALGSKANEIILVNDCSLDETPQIIDRVANAHPARVRAIHHMVNLGPGAARKTGILASSYTTIVFLDADLKGIDPKIIDKLAKPVLEEVADYVLGDFFLEGRITEYTIRPLLRTLFPELAELGQPLSGQLAAKKNYLFIDRMEPRQACSGPLIDVYLAGGRISQVGIGALDHSHRPTDVKKRQALTEVESLMRRYHEYLAIEKQPLTADVKVA